MPLRIAILGGPRWWSHQTIFRFWKSILYNHRRFYQGTFRKNPWNIKYQRNNRIKLKWLEKDCIKRFY